MRLVDIRVMLVIASGVTVRPTSVRVNADFAASQFVTKNTRHRVDLVWRLNYSAAFTNIPALFQEMINV
jgi:hypothetical protein